MGKEVNHGLDVRLKKISYLCLVDRIYRGGKKRLKSFCSKSFSECYSKSVGKLTSPLLLSRYIPPLIWGKSGHIQTALYGKMGRVRSPHPYGHRKFITMSDGATSTFDLFEPLAEHCVGGELVQVVGLGQPSGREH